MEVVTKGYLELYWITKGLAMNEGKFLMLTPSIGAEQLIGLCLMESMWMRTSRVETAYMGGVYMNIDFNHMTNPLWSTQTDHNQCL
jgi:hypothetical protein